MHSKTFRSPSAERLVEHPLRAVCKVLVHVVWSTHLRRPRLVPALDPWLRATFANKAKAAGAQVIEAEIAMNHVHVPLQVSSRAEVADVVQRMKGASSYLCNAQGLMRERLRWQRGYWVQSFEPEHLPKLIEYVRTQRERETAAAE